MKSHMQTYSLPSATTWSGKKTVEWSHHRTLWFSHLSERITENLEINLSGAAQHAALGRDVLKQIKFIRHQNKI